MTRSIPKTRVNLIIKALVFYLFALNVGENLFMTVFAVYATGDSVGASLRVVGFSLATFALFKAAVQLPLSKQLDKSPSDHDNIVALALGALASIAYALGFLAITQPWHLFALQALGGLANGAIFAAYYGLFSRHVDKALQGFEWSLFSIGGVTTAAALGGALSGLIVDWIGFRTLFLVAALMNTLSLVVVLIISKLLGFESRVHFWSRWTARLKSKAVRISLEQ